MDKYEIRRVNLQAIISTKFDGVVASLAKLIGREPSYVTRMTYPEGKPSKKRIGEDMAEVIEIALGIPAGALSDPAGPVSSLDAGAQASAPANNSTVKNEDRAKPVLQWLSDDEAQLLSDYRATDKRGRHLILGTAAGAQKVSRPTAADKKAWSR